MDYIKSQSSYHEGYDSTYENAKFFQEKHTRYKSLINLILVLSTFCLSSTYFGYSMVYLATIQFKVIAQLYNISQSSFGMSISQGIAMAAIPIGAGIGAFNSKILIQKCSRRRSVLLVNCIVMISTIGLFYRQFYFFIFFRFIQGICTGLSSAIIPMIIKQLSPVQISGSLGVLPQLFISIGCTTGYLFAFILGIITEDTSGSSFWMILFAFPIILLSFQSYVLIQIFPYQTPKYLLLEKKISQATQLLSVIYKEEYVEEVLMQKKIDLKMLTQKQIEKTINKIRTRISGLSDKSLHTIIQQHEHVRTNKTAFITAIYLSLLQQFAGPNVAVAYGAQIIQVLLPQLKTAIPTMLMFLTILAAGTTIYLLKYFGRKTLLQIGSLGSGMALLIISFGFFNSNSIQTVVGFVFYMFIFGFTLGPVIWLYIPEIIQPNYIGSAVLFNWIGASTVIGFFPIIIDILPNNNPGFVFAFFAFICFLSLYISHRLIVQTKGKTQKQIGLEYDKLQAEINIFNSKNQREQLKNSIKQDLDDILLKPKNSLEMTLLKKDSQ